MSQFHTNCQCKTIALLYNTNTYIEHTTDNIFFSDKVIRRGIQFHEKHVFYELSIIWFEQACKAMYHTQIPKHDGIFQNEYFLLNLLTHNHGCNKWIIICNSNVHLLAVIVNIKPNNLHESQPKIPMSHDLIYVELSLDEIMHQ